jgi:hypothetical protein
MANRLLNALINAKCDQAAVTACDAVMGTFTGGVRGQVGSDSSPGQRLARHGPVH